MSLSLKKYLIPALSLSALTLGAQSSGGMTTGSALYCDSVNSGFISLTSFNGNILYWESQTKGSAIWTKIYNTTPTQSYTGLKNITSFRAIVKDGFSPQDTSSVSTISVHVPGNGGTISGGGHFCDNSGSGQLVLNNPPGKVLSWQSFLDETSGWSAINNTTTVHNYTNIKQNTSFRAVVETIPGCPNDTSSIAAFKIDALSLAGEITNADTVCYGTAGDTLTLRNYRGTIADWYRMPGTSNWEALSKPTASLSYSMVTQNISYKVVVKNGICPAETTPVVSVMLYNTTPASAGLDQTITKHDPLILQGSGNGTPKWNNANTLDNSNSFQPSAHPLHTTIYVLTLTDAHGCLSSDSVQINVDVPLPSAITPNGDGVNDYFKIDKIYDYPGNSIQIFNRWGKLVYAAQPYQNEWNGKNSSGNDLPDDIYYFTFDHGDGSEILTNYILIKR